MMKWENDLWQKSIDEEKQKAIEERKKINIIHNGMEYRFSSPKDQLEILILSLDIPKHNADLKQRILYLLDRLPHGSWDSFPELQKK